MGDDDRTFRASFTGDGVAKLRQRVCEKLKEFMGDYTDDTLVEYVIVLLKNGRSKAEARNELNVFLGDDSDSFVSWLWDHLGSSLHLYVESRDSQPDETPQINLSSEDKVVTRISSQLNSDSDKLKSGKLPRNRHNREWRSLVRDEEAPAPFRSTVTDKVHLDEKSHDKVSRGIRSTSQKVAQRKRNRPEELSETKGEISAQGNIGPARRLLQFAFKEALATSVTSSSTSEPALKRIRSVVSTSAADSSVESGPRRLRSLAYVPNAMSTAIRAVEEAAKDVAKSSSSRNVFDRLGLSANVSHANDQLTEFNEPVVDDGDYAVCKEIPAKTRPSLVQGRNYRESHGDVGMLETDTCMASDSASDNEGYDHVNIVGQRVTGASGTPTSGRNEGEDSLMVQYSVAKNGDQNMQKPMKEQDRPATVGGGSSNKILNISVNVNTWKPPHYQEPGDIQQVDNRKTVQNIEPSLSRSRAWSMKERTTAVSVANGNTKPPADIQKESPKIPPATQGLYATGRPTEDVDSRTIFVSNVHFAATKDSLSRHFNKFGEVLKVIIVTDAATGQPKGSAYVEFMRKEAAENALSLDGTSFLSRILKVVRKSSAHQDAAPIMMWPRAVRGSPFAPSTRFGRGFLPRGIHHNGAYKARPPIKAGARSLQWKREEAYATPGQEVNNNTATSTNSVIASQSLGVRSLTYVRTDQSTNGR